MQSETIVSGFALTMGMSHGSHYLAYHPGTQPYSQVSATHFKIRHPLNSSMDAQSSNELQWLDLKIGYQDGSPHDSHQGDLNTLLLCIRLQLACALWPVVGV